MATVSGSLLYDGYRTNEATGLPGIAGVPIVLENADTGLRLAVLTATNGNYTFTNVPNGSYRIVEAYGDTGPISSTGNFGAEAAVGPAAVATTPPISYIANPPADATSLDCITRNTLPFSVTGANITGQRISNGPVKYSPVIIDSSITVDWNTNLINAASGGTFGQFPAGTPGMTGADPNPYPGVNPGFIYDLPAAGAAIPSDGYFTIQNIANNISYQVNGSWWRIADHSTGNETGRMMIVNGANNGAAFFEDTVTVTPNTYYLFITRILNLIKITGREDPKLGVLIKAQDGTVLYDKNLGDAIPVNLNVPEWLSDGVIINSGNYTSLDVQFVSLGAAASGNDYAIDDVGFFPVDITSSEPVKSASPTGASTGDTISFKILFTNNTDNIMTSISFNDPMPDGLVFASGSVSINGTVCIGCDPNTGFDLPDLASGDTIEVTFTAIVDHAPEGGIATNTAFVTYNATLVEGTLPLTFTSPSNEVDIALDAVADVYVEKAGPSTAAGGDIVNYNIIIGNNGPDIAVELMLFDSLPAQLSSPLYSLDNGLNWSIWPGMLLLGNLGVGQTLDILIQGTALNPATSIVMTNTAQVASSTPDPNLSNNTSTLSTTLYPNNDIADVFVEMTGSPGTVRIGSTLTYSLTYGNNGPNPAINTELSGVTNELTNLQYSTDGGATWQKWTGAVQLGTLEPGETATMLIKGVVSTGGFKPIINTAIVKSITPDPNLDNNSSTVITIYMPNTREDALNQIVSSIAMEELALSHILNAEGEKIQYAIGTISDSERMNASIDEVFKVNKSVMRTLKRTWEYQILLRSKLNDALNAYKEIDNGVD